MKGAKMMQEFEPDWIVAMGGGSPIDAAKAMWAFYEYPETSFEDLITPFSFPTLRQKAHFCAIPSTSGTATEAVSYTHLIIDIIFLLGSWVFAENLNMVAHWRWKKLHTSCNQVCCCIA